MDCHDALAVDADIAGRGVRISFYIQNILLVLLMKRSNVDTENALWTFVATSFGLTVAALVQWGRHNLTFINGILVSQLVWFANLGSFLALASYSRSKGKDVVIKIAATLQGYFSIILTIIMWASNHKLPGGTCSSIKFVFLFGVELPATKSGKAVALVIASLALAIFTVVSAGDIWIWVGWDSHHSGTAAMPDPEHGPRDEHTGGDEHTGREATPARRGSNHTHEPGVKQHHHHAGKHHKFKRWAGALAGLGSFFFGILLLQIVIFAYFVTTTELIIKKSNATQPSTWSFGQVLAITVVIPSVIAFLRAFKYKWGGPNNDAANNLHRPSLDAGADTGQPQSHLTVPLLPVLHTRVQPPSFPHPEGHQFVESPT